MFRKFSVTCSGDTFGMFSESAIFEDVCDGRKVANLIDCQNDLVPLVRTTTFYNNPSELFSFPHYALIEQIEKVSGINDLKFNSAMMEIYQPKYRKMKFHSDQMLDLADNSYICIFSCYDDEKTKNVRTLKIRNKESRKCSEILLEHNTIILFPIDTNRKHVHKIILDKPESNNKWLGITFRLSKTFIKFENNIPYFHPTNRILTIANNKERREFLRQKGLENSLIEHEYPEIYYTLSASDLSLPFV